MFVAGFPANAFGTNCYVLAPAPGERCVVVDPGVGVTDRLDDLLTRHRLRPVAVLLTHGHVDHTFSVTPVCDAREIPAYVHPGDRAMVADPLSGLSRDLRQMFGAQFTWAEPADVRELPDNAPIAIADLEITIDHAPGHTGGSVLFRLPAGAGSGPIVLDGAVFDGAVFDGASRGTRAVADVDTPLCLSGDVLFAGSIGRTDLPGGDGRAMRASLRTKILPLADETVVLPGHGPVTTIGRERASNPFLHEVMAGPSTRRSR